MRERGKAGSGALCACQLVSDQKIVFGPDRYYFGSEYCLLERSGSMDSVPERNLNEKLRIQVNAECSSSFINQK